MVSFETILTRADLITVLNRHIDVTVLEVSASGCLIESECDVPVGTIGSLSIEANGADYADPIRITRSQPIPGGGERRLLGAEFVWLTLPHPHSVRRLVRTVGGAAPVAAAGSDGQGPTGSCERAKRVSHASGAGPGSSRASV